MLAAGCGPLSIGERPLRALANAGRPLTRVMTRHLASPTQASTNILRIVLANTHERRCARLVEEVIESLRNGRDFERSGREVYA
jgi:hypothetical protein